MQQLAPCVVIGRKLLLRPARHIVAQRVPVHAARFHLPAPQPIAQRLQGLAQALLGLLQIAPLHRTQQQQACDAGCCQQQQCRQEQVVEVVFAQALL